MIEALGHVQLAAPPGSEYALRAYYVDVLGMTELPKPAALAARGGCWFAAGPCRTGSGTDGRTGSDTGNGADGTPAVVLHLGIEAGFRPAKKAHPGIRVSGVDAFAAALAEAGAMVLWDDALLGHRRFYSEDPVGNRLEFLERTDG